MSLKIVTDFRVLMQLAHEQAQARLHGTPEEYAKAREEHEAYRQLCLEADEMIIPQVSMR